MLSYQYPGHIHIILTESYCYKLSTIFQKTLSSNYQIKKILKLMY